MDEGYGWSAIGQWDTPPRDAYIERKIVDTGLSKAVCSYMLVNRTDQGGEYLRCVYIKKDEVTKDILNQAGKI